MAQSEGHVPIDETKNGASDHSIDEAPADNNYLKLRRLLLGDDYSSALKTYISKEDDVERVSDVLAEAVKLSSQHDLGDALAPVVDKAIGKSIEQNPTRITNILFPIMGPAIRKAVASALAEMVQSLNTLLEQSLTFGSLNWRIRAWRSGMPYAQYVLLQTVQYRVEQVLLVHRETGLLLNSVTASEVEAQDPELVSSMLTAISDFVSDSFSDGRETLERIRFGNLEPHLVLGPHAILAVAVRGSASDELALKASTTIETVHSRFGYQLTHFEGDRADFEEVTPILAECLMTQKISQKATRKPWLAIVLILVACGYFINNTIKDWRTEHEYELLEAAIELEPGYVVISANRQGTHLYIKALRSPESRAADSLRLALLKDKNIELVIDDSIVHFGPLPAPVVLPPVIEAPVVKVDPKPVVDIEKVTKVLLVVGEKIIIIAQGERLSVKGKVSEETRQRLEADPTLKSVYDDIDLTGLAVVDNTSTKEQLQTLVDRVQSTVFYFEPNESRLSGKEVLKIPGILKTISELEQVAEESNVSDLQIIIMGFADSSGSAFGNNTVSQQRADGIRSILTENAISSDIIVAWGAGNIDRAVISEHAQRRVTLQVLYSDQVQSVDQVPSSKKVLNSDQVQNIDQVPSSAPAAEKEIDTDVKPGDSSWVK